MMYSQKSWEAAFREAERRLNKKEAVTVINMYNRIPHGSFNNNPLLQQPLKRPASTKTKSQPAKKELANNSKTEQLVGEVDGTNVPVQAMVYDVPKVEASHAAKNIVASDILNHFVSSPKVNTNTTPKSIISAAINPCSANISTAPQQQPVVKSNDNDINASIAAMPNIEAKCNKIRELLATGKFPEINGLTTTSMETKLDIFKSLVDKLPPNSGRVGGDSIYEIEVNSIINILTSPSVKKQLSGIGGKPYGEKNGKLLYKYREVAGTNYPELVNSGFKWFFIVETEDKNKYVLIAIDPIPRLNKSFDKKSGQQTWFWSNIKRIMLMDATTHQQIQINK